MNTDFLYPLNPLFSIVILILAFLTGYVIKRNYKINPAKGRYVSIDGLRGFLGIGVFVHHSAIWYKYIQTGGWGVYESILYTQFGETSVTLFFMISSFLFVSKLLDSEEKGFNWNRFFISRIFRLAPMYYFSLALIIVIVMFMSHWQLNTSVPDFLKSVMHWCFFTISGEPPINNTYILLVNSGVIWSLPYEWLFYFSLPLLAIFLTKNKPTRRYLLLSMIFIIMFYKFHGIVDYFIYPFIGGAIAPFLLKFTSVQARLEKKYISVLCSIVIIISLFLAGHNSALVKTVLIATAFTLVALGNSMFGLLKTSTLRLLGEICYSTYLMHGIVLFLAFNYGFGFEKIKTFTPYQYCLLVFSLTPLVVIISFLGYKYIEKPFINRVKVTAPNKEKLSEVTA